MSYFSPGIMEAFIPYSTTSKYLTDHSAGNFQYTGVNGLKTPIEPMNLDATFWLASCTKLLTTIAALQCVERGQIGLDDDVSSVLTKLKDIDIITGFQEGTNTPILKKTENKVTLRLETEHSQFSSRFR